MTEHIIVDSHCHLDFPDFEGEIPDLVARANDAGVKRMVTICTKLKNEPSVRKIAEEHEAVYYAAGTHPMSAASEPLASVDQLIEISQHPKMVGIGETGLDYHYTAESAEIQKTSLKIHIEAARETDLPLIIHSRAADEDMAAILKDEFKKGQYKCVMHCFSSSLELAKLSLELGFYLSMSGIITFKKSEELRSIFKLAPIDQVLVETDSPYLSPVPFRGKRNEPSYTAHTAEVGASIYEVDYTTFANQTTKNFSRLFSKAAI
ncbi:TatD family hydrolase [Amylibacter sp.]|nr:TatD family hydrolase [Amylibacter sp.]MDA8756540.1 TatD family hydrolase [Amylibacter sp.]MDB2559515.1 TatD family hydrolase [Amylibacter sp.]